jgi:hypothetical protein
MIENDKNDHKVPDSKSGTRNIVRNEEMNEERGKELGTRNGARNEKRNEEHSYSRKRSRVMCSALPKYWMKGTTLFLPLHNTKAGVSPPSLHFAKSKKKRLILISSRSSDGSSKRKKRVVQVPGMDSLWTLQFLVRDFKEYDNTIIDTYDPEVFKTRLVQEGWEPDTKHVSFDPFTTIFLHSLNKRYLEQTSSHLIGKLKSFM